MAEQNKELFIEFVNYCESQPIEKRIDHSTWESCAVGEFARTKGILVGPVFVDSDDYNLTFKNFIRDLQGEEINDTSKLVNPVSKYLHRCNLPNNYGEFTKFLKQYL